MLTIIAFIITILGSVNWLMIGLLQYDFIAGIFGYQASVFSRIIYIIFGIACGFLVFKLFKGKGTLAVFSRRNKKDLAKNIEKMGKSKSEKEAIEQRYATSNVESGEEFIRRDYDERTPPHTPQLHEDRDFKEYHTPRSMFDEHFDDRGER